MRRVLMIGFEGVQTLDLTGPSEVFAATARELGRPVYRVRFCSSRGKRLVTTSSLRIETDRLSSIRPGRNDIVIVAGGEEAAVRAATADLELLGWLAHARPRVGRMASVCSGAFVLAAAGLLNDKRAATHWSACDRLATLYPRVRVDKNAIFVREGSLWTSAGVTTGIDMALAMVEEDQGRAVADAVAARLVLYVRRPGFQSQFSDALVSQRDAQNPLGPAIAWARSNLDGADVEALAHHAGLSLRTLHRRCLETLGTTPAKLLDKLRVEHARTLLSSGEQPLKALAARAGFGTATRMRRAFERELGMGPREYRALHVAPTQ